MIARRRDTVDTKSAVAGGALPGARGSGAAGGIRSSRWRGHVVPAAGARRRVDARHEPADTSPMRRLPAVLVLLCCLGGALPAAAADAAAIDGAKLGYAWAIPFVGILMSIALFPLFAPDFWGRHFDKVALFWTLAFLVPAGALLGPGAAAHALAHTVLLEYMPFIILLFSLFVVAGGIRIVGNLIGTPNTNTALLAFGAVNASFLGTTGASMILIRPMIRANADRRHNVHVFVFFIILVSNIGGSLTPLGDPPLFLGFLKGVDFLWPMERLLPATIVSGAYLLAIFWLVDRYMWTKEPEPPMTSAVPRQVRIEGAQNMLYLAGIVGAVLASGVWETDITIPVFGIELPFNGLTRDAVLIAIAAMSLRTTPQRIRIENAFTWLPIREVAVLFAAIFVTIIPVLAMLQAGRNGGFAPLLDLVTQPDGSPRNWAYFWLTGSLSSYLDNAPTYLVFFNLAGGDPQQLMGPMAQTLMAISAGAVFMGANSYIGNAPNFMVKAICEERGIRMPSFFGYQWWAFLLLFPLFVLLTLLFFL
jgi:Na+/H+ antiporter NhaD/arsenite permease-like protein